MFPESRSGNELRRFGLLWLMALVFLYTTPIWVVTSSLIVVLIRHTEVVEGLRAGVIGGLLWGVLFTLAMGILAYINRKELEKKYKCAGDYSPAQKRKIQLPGSVTDVLALSAQTLRDFRWIQGDSIEISEGKISAKTSIVKGRNSIISIMGTSLTPGWTTIEIESGPRHWLPVDCTLECVKNVEEISEGIVKRSRSTGSDREYGAPT